MSKMSVAFYSKYKKLLYKYADSPDSLLRLKMISWYSFPVVYTNIMVQLKRCENELQKIKDKRKRIKKYIRGMYATYTDLYLLTLTFEDNVLEKNSSDSLKQMVCRYCNSLCLDYYACADYGKKNGRLHFHVICALDVPLRSKIINGYTFYDIVNSSDIWLKGFYSIRKIKKDITDTYKSLNYAFKSASYSFKSADSKIKPFHKRGIKHFDLLESDNSLPF